MKVEPASRGVAANTSVESLGVYLPEREVTTRAVIKGCRRRVLVPLERMTGIRSRRMAGETEFAIDLAKGAVARCLAQSRHDPAAIDLIIAANISSQDSPVIHNFEPATATVLRQHFGLHGAVAFDLGNACAGVFTAIMVVDELIRRGDIRRALVVSGEYITHLTGTAQRELEGIHDQRLACLTLGDAGICLLLEQGDGFEFIDLYTMPEHADLCVAHSAESHGAIMFTDSVALARAALTDIVAHYHALVEGGRVVDNPAYFIPHQTSSNSIKQATRMTNRRFGRTVCHTGNMVDNLKHRGNTATTSHWVALKDLIDDTAVQAGQRVLFSIQASGITIGLAQYRVDEFASRGANGRRPKQPPPAPRAPDDSAAGGYHRTVPVGERVRIAAAATHAGTSAAERGNVTLAAGAVQRALAAGAAGDRHLGLLVYSGIYREAFVSEPALATLVARELGLKGSCVENGTRPLLAFDLMNGPPGVLMACQVAGRLLLSRDGLGVLAASEYAETPVSGQPALGVARIGSALVLERSADATGFRSFYFAGHPEYLERYRSYAQTDESGPPRLGVVSDAGLQDCYLAALAASVRAMLRREQRTLDDFGVIFPPQISPQFLARLAAVLEVEPARLVACGQDDLFTSAPAGGWEAAQARGVQAGTLGLFLTVGPGIEVACASYRF
jgi:3-oxoacyl-[acyl-carrier-protein] synthase III